MPKTSKDPSAVKECLLRNCKFSCNPQGTLITTICLSKMSVFIINLMQLKVLSTGWCTKCIHQVPPQLSVFLFRSSPQVLCVKGEEILVFRSFQCLENSLGGWNTIVEKVENFHNEFVSRNTSFVWKVGAKVKYVFSLLLPWHFRFDGCWPPNITTQSRNIHPRNLTWNLKKVPGKGKSFWKPWSSGSILNFGGVKRTCSIFGECLWQKPFIQFWAPLGPHSVEGCEGAEFGDPEEKANPPVPIPSLVGLKKLKRLPSTFPDRSCFIFQLCYLSGHIGRMKPNHNWSTISGRWFHHYSPLDKIPPAIAKS